MRFILPYISFCRNTKGETAMDEFKLEVGGEYVDGQGNRVLIEAVSESGNFYGTGPGFFYQPSGDVFPAGEFSDTYRLRPIPE